MINTILGKKVTQSQKFLEDGRRVPITTIWAGENYVVQKKADRAQLGFDTKKHITKPVQGILKKAGITKNLRFFHEIVIGDEAVIPGSTIATTSVFKPGDLVDVMGVSKGKGFAGVVKRHHFKGGPRTHGQSVRERAPGSIGQTTTPGRVYKGKLMAGRMGGDRVTVKNLQVLDVANDLLTVSGLVPGGRNSLLVITKIGEAKKFVPLYDEKKEEPEEKTQTSEENVEEVKQPEEKQEVKTETGEEKIQEVKEDAS